MASSRRLCLTPLALLGFVAACVSTPATPPPQAQAPYAPPPQGFAPPPQGFAPPPGQPVWGPPQAPGANAYAFLPAPGQAAVPPPQGPLRPETFHPRSSRQSTRALMYLPGRFGQENVAYDVVDGVAVVEGDIVLGPAGAAPLRYGVPWDSMGGGRPDLETAVVTRSRSHIWPGSQMPYEIHRSVGRVSAGYVAWAVEHMNTTPLKLRPRTSADRDYVVFVDSGDGSGCSSYIGRIGGPQQIELADCGRGSVVHEILHAAGFWHEQSRNDRDNFINIIWDEIDSDARDNFEKAGTSGVDVGAYDFESMMHYSQYAFSRRGRPTIVPKVSGTKFGQREGLSAGDRRALNMLYGSGTAPTAPPVQPPPRVTPPPVPTLRPPTTPPPAARVASFAGLYSSTRGNMSCGQSGAFVQCAYPGGLLYCFANGTTLDCGWSGNGQGRAAFSLQGNLLVGAYGDGPSNSNRGVWSGARSDFRR